jgi:hypothetical protein
MTDNGNESPSLQFTLDPNKPSKRPEQLAALLETTLQREFPKAASIISVSHSPDAAVVGLCNLKDLEDDIAKKVVHRARVVFNDFMISPWY